MAKKKPPSGGTTPKGQAWHESSHAAGLRNLVSWKPGQSGNPAGSRPGRKLTALLREAVDSRTLCGVAMPEGVTVGEALIQVALRHAFEGDSTLIREVFMRLDGRVPEQIDLNLSHLSDADLIARATGLAGRAGAEGPDGPGSGG